MALTFRTAGDWGVGKGGNLLPAEVDANFYELAQQIAALGAGPAPAEIDEITLVGSQLTITLSDARIFGPFTLPIGGFAWRGEWTSSTAYAVRDVVSVAGVGVYLVLQAHSSAGVFDAGATLGGAPVYELMLAASAGGGGVSRSVVTIAAATFNAPVAEAMHRVVWGTATCTVTIPHDTDLDLPVGTILRFTKEETGDVIIQNDGVKGNWINWPPAYDNSGSATMAASPWSVVTLMKTAANEWMGWGDLTPAA